jgi:hypothetical protein
MHVKWKDKATELNWTELNWTELNRTNSCFHWQFFPKIPPLIYRYLIWRLCFVRLSQEYFSSYLATDSKITWDELTWEAMAKLAYNLNIVFEKYIINMWEQIYGPPPWSSGQSSWLQIQRPGFRYYQKKKLWFWNGVHLASWVQLRSYLKEK